MIANHLSLIHRAEQKIGVASSGTAQKFKRFGNTWIKADKSLKEVYNTIQYSELPWGMNTTYTVWGKWFLRLFKRNRKNVKAIKLFGIKNLWNFTSSVYQELQADIIYIRSTTIILIYATLEKPRVVKIAFTKNSIKLTINEIQAHKIAFKTKHLGIVIPDIYHSEMEDKSMLVIEEYLRGKKQSFKDNERLQSSYKRVFPFMIKHYLNNPIELKPLSEISLLKKEAVLREVAEKKEGKFMIDIVNHLKEKNKNLIRCCVHGDLNHNNVLSCPDGNIAIIDWALSKHDYIYKDLKISKIDTESFFYNFIEKAKLTNKNIYDYHEQFFLGLFIYNCRLIARTHRKAVADRIHRFIESNHKKLIDLAVIISQKKNL